MTPSLAEPERRRALREMGIVPMVLRGTAQPEAVADPRTVWLLAPSGARTDPREHALLEQIVAAAGSLGLVAELTWTAAAVPAGAACLAFGVELPGGACTALAAPAELLADGSAKRAVWAALVASRQRAREAT